MKKSLVLSLAVMSAMALVVPGVRADDDQLDPSKLPPAAAKTGVTYDGDIKAIFDKSCVKCHSGDKAKGKLHLDSLDGVLKGGKDGKAVIGGNLAKSPLVFAVAHIGDDSDFMPPPESKSKLPPLTKDQVGLIRAWIEQGAK
jgi:Planctomycete cytochrome C